MTQSRTVRVGVVGAGANTRARHLPGLLALQDVEVVAVCNRTADSSRRVAQDFQIPRVHDDWRELVTSEDVDAVVIGTWPNMHRELTIAALDAGKHVLCEARMAMNSTEARDMLEASRRNPDLIAQLVPSPLSFTVDATIQRMIASRDLGSILAVDIAFRTGHFLDLTTPLDWRKDKSLSGNNVIALGIWYETLMRWIGRASSVTAMSLTGSDTENESSPMRLPDHLEVLAQMENGALARIQMSDVSGLDPANMATIYGADATLQFRDNTLHFGKKGDQTLAELEIPVSERSSWRVEEEFIAAIRDNEPFTLTDFETGVAYMEFTDAVWRSIESGCSVQIPSNGQLNN